RMPATVTLLQTEPHAKGQLHAIAGYDENATAADLNFTDGSLVITMEPDQGQRYQGITSIAGGNIASALEDYFAQSEQLASRFWRAADGERFAAGLMLQKLPTPAGKEADLDAWDRVNHLAGTIKEEELLYLPAATVLHRLFHEEQTRIYPASELSFLCTCSKPRIAAAIAQLGQDELNSMVQEQGKIDITCEFCQQHYSFDQAQVDALFSSQPLHRLAAWTGNAERETPNGRRRCDSFASPISRQAQRAFFASSLKPHASGPKRRERLAANRHCLAFSQPLP